LLTNQMPDNKPKNYLLKILDTNKSFNSITGGDGIDWITPEGILYLIANEQLQMKLNGDSKNYIRIFIVEYPEGLENENSLITSLRMISQNHSLNNIRFFRKNDYLKCISKDKELVKSIAKINGMQLILKIMQASRIYSNTEHKCPRTRKYHNDFYNKISSSFLSLDINSEIKIFDRILREEISSRYAESFYEIANFLEYWLNILNRTTVDLKTLSGLEKIIPDFAILDQKEIIFSKANIEQIITSAAPPKVELPNSDDGRCIIYSQDAFKCYQTIFNKILQFRENGSIKAINFPKYFPRTLKQI